MVDNRPTRTYSSAFGPSNEPTPEVAAHVTVDHRAYAQLAIRAMEQQLGIDGSLVRLIISQEPGEQKSTLVLVDASPNGQHLGKYNQILALRAANPVWYTLELLGERFDPLSFTTEAVYRAMISDAQARGETVMPDSIELSHQNTVPWTATMLTGEELTDEGLIPIGSFSSDKVDVVGFNPNKGGVSMRVRPSLVIDSL